MKTLKNRLKNGVKPCYLLEGDDVYLFDRAFSMIKKASMITLDDFNVSIFDDDNYSAKAVVDACEVMPMGDEYRLVCVKNIQKIGQNDKKIIENYLNNPLLSTILVILDFYGTFATLKENCEYVDCKRMDRALAVSVVVNELAKKNKQISQEAVGVLLDYCNGYLTGAMNELDKLVFYDTTSPLVTRKVVETVANQNDEWTVFELTEALGKKNADKAIKLLHLMEKNPSTLSLITNHFRRLFFIGISDMDNASLANLLGVKEYAISKQRDQVKNFSKMQLKKIYALLEKIDFMIKIGQMLQSNAIHYLIFSILYI